MKHDNAKDAPEEDVADDVQAEVGVETEPVPEPQEPEAEAESNTPEADTAERNPFHYGH